MRPKAPASDSTKALLRLVETPAIPRITAAARVVGQNRRMIRKAMRLGHGLNTLSRELNLPKRTLQRQLNEVGLFFRKPRVRKGRTVKKNLDAISRAKMAALANV